MPKITCKYFETHNLEGNQMYYKNISLHLAHLQIKKNYFYKKKF